MQLHLSKCYKLSREQTHQKLYKIFCFYRRHLAWVYQVLRLFIKLFYFCNLQQSETSWKHINLLEWKNLNCGKRKYIKNTTFFLPLVTFSMLVSLIFISYFRKHLLHNFNKKFNFYLTETLLSIVRPLRLMWMIYNVLIKEIKGRDLDFNVSPKLSKFQQILRKWSTSRFDKCPVRIRKQGFANFSAISNNFAFMTDAFDFSRNLYSMVNFSQLFTYIALSI